MEWNDLAEIAFDRLGDSRNRVEAAVDDTAMPGEAPLAVTSARARQEWTNGTLVLTTHRLLHVKEGRAAVPVPLAGITDVQTVKSRLIGPLLKVTTMSGAHRWENVDDIETFCDALRTAVANAAARRPDPDAGTAVGGKGGAAGDPDGTPVPRQARQEGPSWIDQIERLAELHGRGALTDEEFALAKRKLIER
ncbi:SHOCT domain-containing protein [Streptomyces sp. NPDC048639]|uniref:SHOCT domain-containing protein n=1 Tax=Streptomyces sp. NPDC048639 TaxID=3365581 RepID=UPI00371AB3DD